ncbi:MAG TPA: prepilin-type N-terminal cleavage/methylation domain-containing protein [Pyrinomonadaceae bacterium]|nr:prepilin-type N-terminal cleavage/methylation domain-containing protein [Pyrinomonadaceae bacterium]
MRLSLRTRNKKRQEKGFTLVETACALLVMMIGGLGICAVFVYAIKNNTGSRDRAAALAVAQQQMERYRLVTFIDPLMTAHAATTETVTSADRTYTVRTTITDTTTSLKTIRIEVTPLLSSDPWALGTVEISMERSTFALGPYSGGL